MPDIAWSDNHLLAMVAGDDRERLLGSGELVRLGRGDNLLLPGQPISFGWFPLSGLVSVIALDSFGAEAEVGVIGCEGYVIPRTLLGDDVAAMRVLVQIPGSALRVPASVVRQAMAVSEPLRRLMLAFTNAHYTQVAYSALAFAHYTVEARLARWLLICADRIGNEILLTHDTLSIMLGVRRAGITVAMQALVAAGAVHAHRSRIIVLDRQALSRLAGGYGDSEADYRRLLGWSPAT